MSASSAVLATSRVNAFIRQRAILSWLEESEFIRMRDIATEWHVSSMTARRDVEALARKGLVSRTRGGASRLSQSVTVSRGDKLERSGSRAMFEAAARLAKPGMTIGIAGGSGSRGLIKALRGIPRLTIVTNAMSVVSQLSEDMASSRSVDLIVLPGLVDDEGSTTGPPCAEAIRTLSLDLTFFGVGGFDEHALVFSDTVAAGEIAFAFGAVSRRSVALIESGRWEITGPFALPASMFDTLISDFEPSEKVRVALARGEASELIVSRRTAA